METLNLFARAFYLNRAVVSTNQVLYIKVPYQLDKTVEEANALIKAKGWDLVATNNKCGGIIVSA